MGKLRGGRWFLLSWAAGKYSCFKLRLFSAPVRIHTHHALLPRCCQFFSKCWPQPTPRTQVGMSFIYCCVCMSMRFMMCVQGMNVLQRCVEVRGQLSQVSSPVSLIEARSLSALGALGWLPRELRVGSPVSASWDYRCTLLPLAFFHKSSCD